MATAETHLVLRNSRVLIASSNEVFRRQWIGNSKYDAVDVEEAAGGADALAKLESENWGEVLLDRRLHDLDVDEVIHIIHMRHPHLLVRLVDSNLVVTDPQEILETVNDSARGLLPHEVTDTGNSPFTKPQIFWKTRNPKPSSPRRVWILCPE